MVCPEWSHPECGQPNDVNRPKLDHHQVESHQLGSPFDFIPKGFPQAGLPLL